MVLCLTLKLSHEASKRTIYEHKNKHRKRTVGLVALWRLVGSVNWLGTCIMTPAQKQTLEKVNELLREHFTAAVLVTQAELGDREDAIGVSWHGGYPTSIGLLELAKLRVWRGEVDPGEPRCGGMLPDDHSS